MDEAQTDHLRAYGVVYRALQRGVAVKWLLNWRGGSFLITQDAPQIREDLDTSGVYYEPLTPAQAEQIEASLEGGNYSSVLLEKAPKIAVYIPHYEEPWDDAVSLALEYAGIPYDRIWDDEVLSGKIYGYDWVHLHHEDFTGQLGKFYASYRNAPWYQEQERVNREVAKKWGFPNVPEEKKAVARIIRDFVARGGFLFAMCSAPITLDIALAAEGVDIVDTPFDGDPPDPDCNERLDYSKTLAFKDFHVITSPYVYEHSDVDVTQEAALRGPRSYFKLFEFSAKFDPVPTMLTQDHVAAIKEFLGQDTGFRKSKLKENVVVLAEVPGTDEAKYIYGVYGRGFFAYLGGHDPEDYQHFVGDPPTDLRKHKHSPGYRLILNNVLFPAARKKRLKT